MASKPKPSVKLTPNQVIAYNLARAREWKHWTQEQAADALAPYLGTRWSKATFSAAERSVDGKVVRQFTGDDLVAFARCFDVPLSWFFMPPPPTDDEGRSIRLATPDTSDGEDLTVLVDLVFGEPSAEPLVGLRLEEWLDRPDGDEPSEGERSAGEAAARRIAAIMRANSDGLDRWRDQLMEIAGHLDNLIGLASLSRFADPENADRVARQSELIADPSRAAAPVHPRQAAKRSGTRKARR